MKNNLKNAKEEIAEDSRLKFKYFAFGRYDDVEILIKAPHVLLASLNGNVFQVGFNGAVHRTDRLFYIWQ